MTPTHAYCTNGKTWAELRCAPGAEPDAIARALRLLDGISRYSFLLWRMPEGKGLGEVDPNKLADVYMQCAGSAEKMCVEVRRRTKAGVEHFVVGRNENQSGEVKITWDAFDAVVGRNEVFTASEAARLFASYLETGWVPDDYALRPLDL